ncbi:MAG TPA: efflux RND transporter permease subunit [Thermoanaerobaculia bacterium]|nr:efflux RND transporter permease subunit [Thermoanaerobaculia bacterium]
MNERKGFIAAFIRQPVFTTMIMIGLVVLGLFAFRRLPIDQYPEVTIPVVAIQTVYPGSSPEVVEREVTKRIEQVVNPISGVDKITSTSLESASIITIEFDLGTDIDSATADVRSKIDQIRRDLPEDIDPPIVQQFDPSEQAILSLALSSKTTPIGELTTYADTDLRRALESVDGVGRVQITGGLTREIHVVLNAEAMNALQVTPQQVMTALAQQNLEIPAGRIESRNSEQLVRVFGRIGDLHQFAGVIVRDGVRISDVATIEDSTEEARSLALINGRRAVGIDIVKVSGGNTVEVADGVAATVARLRGTLPEDVELSIVRDNSVDIRNSVASVQHELILGAILTVLIVFLFLGDAKATTITALALPVSVISTFILLGALGFTLNVLTLMALSLAIGILVDDAIVVIQNIVRHRELGESFLDAALEGTKEIFLAVMATTFTVVAVFVPVAFMGGIIGRFFYEFGLTIAWAVLVSLLVSFTLTPMLAAVWKGKEHAHAKKTSFRRLFDNGFDRFASLYERAIHWVLRHRKSTVAVAFASLIGAVLLLPLIGGGFMPDQDNGEFSVVFETPAGSSFDYTVAKAREIDTKLRAMPGVVKTYTTVGAGLTGTVTKGEVFVELVPRGERATGLKEFMQNARTALGSIHNAEVSVLAGGGMGGAQKPLQVVIRGENIDELQRLSGETMKAVARANGAIEVESSLGDPKPEVQLRVDIDKAHDLGLDVAQIATAVQPLVAGSTATRWEDPRGEERDVVVRLPLAQRATMTTLANIPITTPQGDTIPLGAVASLESGASAAEIERENLERVATVSANLAPGANVGDVSNAIRAELAKLRVPTGYTISLGGETEQLAETTGYVLESLFLAIVLIYLILASQFGSFTQPVAIMMSLPLSLVGVMAALLLTGDTLNMMSMIGVILLMGLVTKNAILLVDNANQRRAEGVPMFEALAEAGKARLRPIMMTTLAMIFGMLPIALGLGEGGEFRAPMARAVIGGLVTSTALTLIVVPVIYSYLEGLSARLLAKLRQEEAEPSEELVTV